MVGVMVEVVVGGGMLVTTVVDLEACCDGVTQTRMIRCPDLVMVWRDDTVVQA